MYRLRLHPDGDASLRVEPSGLSLLCYPLIMAERRDSNPRYALRRTHAFQACSLNHSDTSPDRGESYTDERAKAMVFSRNRPLYFYCNYYCNKKQRLYCMHIMKQTRQTKQREVLESICMESEQPLTIDQILEAAHTQLPSLNRVTAYRNLNRMVEAVN